MDVKITADGTVLNLTVNTKLSIEFVNTGKKGTAAKQVKVKGEPKPAFSLAERERSNITIFKSVDEILQHASNNLDFTNTKISRTLKNLDGVFNRPEFRTKPSTFFKGIDNWNFYFVDSMVDFLKGCINFDLKLKPNSFNPKTNTTDMLYDTAVSDEDIANLYTAIAKKMKNNDAITEASGE